MTDRPSTRERRHAATRRALAEHALRLFAEKGYDATTVADIADAADMSTRTFFRHVRDKDEALFAADEDVFDTVVEAADRAADLPPLARLVAALGALVEHAEKAPDAKCTREEVLDAHPALRARDLAQQLRWQGQAEGYLRERGVPADDAALAAGLTLTVWREGYRRWIGGAGRAGTLTRCLDEVVAELPGHLTALRPRTG
ncbi:TetR/AcrR family transcriptional regulator [Kineococcus sp. SYSU DK002]|uniref:TetR/AcrR family transcriptional regulator n=1 Tax=Kineococcus sp. SYSU DK002 TaxID=3383123 RepID=UPI003D7D3159